MFRLAVIKRGAADGGFVVHLGLFTQSPATLARDGCFMAIPSLGQSI